MKSNAVNLFLLLSQTISISSLPPNITFTGIIRDFSNFHPDFESPAQWCREQPGILMPTLADNSRPVSFPPELRTDQSLGIYRSCRPNQIMNRTRYTVANFGQAFLDEYYQDVPGVNIPIPVSIVLKLINESLGLYQYTNNKFFPINGKGYVREMLDSNRFLNRQVNLKDNYWFTTEIQIPFFYTGIEVFSFVGDDDLWVFIDGQLTTCDLGSIHIQMGCTVDLTKMNLKPNTIHHMKIFHAERHFIGSTFQVTTSIVPVNLPPQALDFEVNINENAQAIFQLQGFDPDNNPDLKAMILNDPPLGALNVPSNTWLPLNQEIIYSPPLYYNGNFSLAFMITDNMNNSNVAYLTIIVNPVNFPPVPVDVSLTLKVGETKSIRLLALDYDTPETDLRFYLASPAQLGYAVVDNTTGVFTYTAVQAGSENVLWEVGDGSGLYVARVEIIVLPPTPDMGSGNDDDGDRETISTGVLAAIIVGAFLLLAIISGVLAWICYNSFLAGKFQRTWESEFYKIQMQQNPLYKSAVYESSNPLYTSKDQLDNTI